MAPSGAISQQQSIAQLAIGDKVIVWTEEWMSHNQEATVGTIKVIQKGQIGVSYYDSHQCALWMVLSSIISYLIICEDDDIKTAKASMIKKSMQK